VDEALEIARHKRWFRIDVTGPENERGARAVRFYEKMGFEYTGPKLRRLLRR
jgi:ribosomal protein S18 acetylase RimI-like enzyme